MIVAAGAADGQAEHRRAGGANDIIQLLVTFFFDGVGRNLCAERSPPLEKSQAVAAKRERGSFGAISSLLARCQRTNASCGKSRLMPSSITKSR